MTKQPFDIKRFAAERSHQNSKISSELGQAAAQAVLLINGGAATAILTFAKGSSTSFDSIRWSVVGYSAGVLLGAFMIFAQNRMLDARNARWQTYFMFDETPGRVKREKQDKRGKVWFYFTYGSFFLSAFAFFTASVSLAHTLVKVDISRLDLID